MMHRLSNKYKVPESTLKEMIKDGILPCHWPEREEIYDRYRKLKAMSGQPKNTIYKQIATERNMSPSMVRWIVEKLQHLLP